jgi:adenine deaminase
MFSAQLHTLLPKALASQSKVSLLQVYKHFHNQDPETTTLVKGFSFKYCAAANTR